MHSAGGEVKRALELHRRAFSMAQKSQNRSLAASTLAAMGRVHFESMDWKAARPMFDEAAALFESCGDRRNQALAIFSVAKIDMAEGHELLHQAPGMFRQIGATCNRRPLLHFMSTSLYCA